MKSLRPWLLIGLLTAGSALAVVDPDANSMGLYFDLQADVYEETAAAGTIVPVHVILTNPAMAEILGWECGVKIHGGAAVLAVHLIRPGALNNGHSHGISSVLDADYMIVYPDPYPTSAATLLATFDVLLLDDDPVYLLMQGTTPSVANDPRFPVTWAGDGLSFVTTGVFSWDAANDAPAICAIINGTGVVSTEATSWGLLKSLFR